MAGKAMFVCSNRNIAYDLYKIIIELRPEWAEKKVCPDGVELSEADKKDLKPIEMVKLVICSGSQIVLEVYLCPGVKV